MRLHLGCGPHKLPGWENHDADIDLRKRLPYADGSVEFIFTEHVVEHLKIREAWNFFEECRRILKVGGVVRTTVPSIVKVWQEKTPEYLALIKKRRWGDGTDQSAVKLLVFRHRHKSLWTGPLLLTVLAAIGFSAREVAVHLSDHEALRDVEQHGKSIGDHANDLESISVEATK